MAIVTASYFFMFTLYELEKRTGATASAAVGRESSGDNLLFLHFYSNKNILGSSEKPTLCSEIVQN